MSDQSGNLQPIGAEEQANASSSGLARIVFLESDYPKHATAYCGTSGCLSSLSYLGNIDFDVEGSTSLFTSAYDASDQMLLPCYAVCRCCHVASLLVDTRRGGAVEV